jgi:hypothetical protein
MRLPRVRFTVRRLMIAVAVVASLLGGSIGILKFIGNYRVCQEKTAFHTWRVASFRDHAELCRLNHEASLRRTEKYAEASLRRTEKYAKVDPHYAIAAASSAEWWRLNLGYTRQRIAYHDELAKKYRRLAWRPRQPVEPDPPEPYWDGNASAPPDLVAKLTPPPSFALDPNDKELSRLVEEMIEVAEALDSSTRKGNR